jgi:FkbM family methyltransferase
MSMKNSIIRILQRFLGFERYLFFFAVITFYKLKWDKNERDFLKLFDYLKTDGLILDIGANIGVMTTSFAKRKRNSTVYAFEPIPVNFLILKRIVDFFKLSNVRVFNFALSNVNGKTKMIMPIIESARKHGLSRIPEVEDYAYENCDEFDVVTKQLDDISEIRDTTANIIAIKIDVEGHELSVLKGATETIKKHRPIIYCELWPGDVRRLTISFIKSLGYSIHVLVRNEIVEYEDQSNQNFFFMPEIKN